MTKFIHLKNSEKNAAARDAIHRVLSGARMREHDAEALQHAASILELFIVPEVDYDKREREFVGPRDFFDTLAMQPNKTPEGRPNAG